MNDQRLEIRIPTALKKRLREEASQTGYSIADIVRNALLRNFSVKVETKEKAA